MRFCISSLFVFLLMVVCSGCRVSERGIAMRPAEVPELNYLDSLGYTLARRHYVYCFSRGVYSCQGKIENHMKFATCDRLNLTDARLQMIDLIDDCMLLYLNNSTLGDELKKMDNSSDILKSHFS